PVPVVLAVDIGTTAAKALVVADDDDARLRPAARRQTPIGHTGTADVDAVVQAVEELLDEAVRRLTVHPDAIAFSSAWHTLVGLDQHRRPTTELTTWIDGRSGAEAGELRRALPDDEIRHR